MEIYVVDGVLLDGEGEVLGVDCIDVHGEEVNELVEALNASIMESH